MKLIILKLKARISFINKLNADLYVHNLFSPEETAELSAPLVAQVIEMQETIRQMEAELALITPPTPQV